MATVNKVTPDISYTPTFTLGDVVNAITSTGPAPSFASLAAEHIEQEEKGRTKPKASPPSGGTDESPPTSETHTPSGERKPPPSPSGGTNSSSSSTSGVSADDAVEKIGSIVGDEPSGVQAREARLADRIAKDELRKREMAHRLRERYGIDVPSNEDGTVDATLAELKELMTGAVREGGVKGPGARRVTIAPTRGAPDIEAANKRAEAYEVGRLAEKHGTDLQTARALLRQKRDSSAYQSMTPAEWHNTTSITNHGGQHQVTPLIPSKRAVNSGTEQMTSALSGN